jgi:hypothetical protein
MGKVLETRVSRNGGMILKTQDKWLADLGNNLASIRVLPLLLHPMALIYTIESWLE